MDDNSIGHHCTVCSKKDFFAFQCPTCELYYCADHRHVTCDAKPEVKKLGVASTEFI